MIGLGTIGYGRNGNFGENHFQAISDSDIELVAVVESEKKRALEFSNKTQIPAFLQISEVPDELTYDLAVISSPAYTHDEIVRYILQTRPETSIFCEKPFAISAETSQMLLFSDNQKNGHRRVWVDYTRQFSPGYLRLKEQILDKNFLGGEVRYNYGLERSCSHYIRIAIGLFGKPISLVSLETRTSNPSFTLEFSDERILSFVGVGDLGVRIADFTLLFADAHLIITDADVARLYNEGHYESPVWSNDLRDPEVYSLRGGLKNFYSMYQASSLDSIAESLELDILTTHLISEIHEHSG